MNIYKNSSNYDNIKKIANKINLFYEGNNIDFCLSLQKYIQNEVGEKIECINSKDEIDDNIALVLKRNKKKYDFYLLGKLGETTNSFNKIFDFSEDIYINTKYNLEFYINYNCYDNYKYKQRFDIFLEFQILLSKYLIIHNNQTQNKQIFNKNIEISTGINKYPKVINDLEGKNIFIEFSISFYFSLYTYFFISRMIEEKEKKLINFLEKKGISISKYYFSWFISYLLISLIQIIELSACFFIKAKFNCFIFLLNLVLLTFSLFSVTFFFATLINSIKTSSGFVKFYYIGFSFFGFITISPSISKKIKIVLSFIPQINNFNAINCFLKLISARNISGKTFELFFIEVDKISFIECVIIYIIDIFSFSLISILIHLYRKSGLNFNNFIKSLFIKDLINNDINYMLEFDRILDDNDDEFFPMNLNHQELSKINKLKKNQNKYLKFQNISKNFKTLQAVNNFNAELFPDEIFCLLGNNGAGKTTLINMISGFMKPTNGNIYFNNRSLITDKTFIYGNIGLCEQEDIFFGHLTVEEHLEYIYQIKKNIINRIEINNLISRIHLNEKKDSLCSTLSGGQKRKLCIALALIGSPKVILLDEPTSGMDIPSKIELWNFLKDYKKDKIILYTTHSLDEAEYLGDRIGILYDGKFICSGTSSYLKTKYSCGFSINLIINSLLNEKKKQIFFEEIKKFDNKASIKINNNKSYSMNITTTNNIKQLFEYIDKSKEEYDIKDYTINSTTLEDVFLKIINNDNSNTLIQKDINEEIMNIYLKFYNENMVYSKSFCLQLKAQITRNLYPLIRNKINFVVELLSSLAFIYIFIFLLLFLFLFNNSKKFFFFQNKTLDFKELLKSKGNYIYQFNNNYIKNSSIYMDISNHIQLQNIADKQKNILNFMDFSYNNAFGNYVKGSMYLEINITNFNIYISRAINMIDSYLYANMILLFSAFLKNEYDIDASILSKFEIFESEKNNNIFVFLLFFYIGSFLGFIIFLSGLIPEKIKERIKNIKHLLYLSGCNLWSYWFGFFIVDFLKVLIYIFFLYFPAFFFNKDLYYFLINTFFIIISSLIFIYSASFLFLKEDSGNKFLFLLMFIFILIYLIVSFIIINYGDFFVDMIYFHLFTFFDITPISSMILSFFRLIFYIYADRTKVYIYLMVNCFVQIMNFLFYGLILILIESGIFRHIKYIINNCFTKKNEFILDNYKDTNIDRSNMNIKNILETSSFAINEIQLISSNLNLNESLNIDNSINEIINNDKKNYKNIKKEESYINPFIANEISNIKNSGNLNTKIEELNVKYKIGCCKYVNAVNNLYLNLEINEKFGLLGYNGSGKSTIFKAITNEILYDSGKISLFGYDNYKEFDKIRKNLGYCPQINPLFDFMKVKEIIKFYLELKTSEGTVESICKKFGLEKYINTYCINLSGGNKRKLTLAIALMNKPNLVLLDEPSTGVDPLSKRIIWKSINELAKGENSFNMILTTHSMEEAEILCDRVSWLKDGNFICIGNPEELKLQYSKGYSLYIKFNDTIINLNESILNEDLEEVYNNLTNLVHSKDNNLNFILNNKDIKPFILELIKVIILIKPYTKKIELIEIRKDYSFVLLIDILGNEKKNLFTEIITMKYKRKEISEMIISLERLENILLSFK